MALLALMVRAFLLVVLVDTFRRDIILYHLSLPFISIVYLSPLRTIYVLYLGILASSRLLSTRGHWGELEGEVPRFTSSSLSVCV